MTEAPFKTRGEIIAWKKAATVVAVGMCAGAVLCCVLYLKAPVGSMMETASQFVAIILCMGGMYAAGILSAMKWFRGYRHPKIGLK